MTRLLIVALATVTGGCAWFPHAPSEPDLAPAVMPAPAADYAREKAEVSALLAYYQGLLAMPQEELRREYQSVNQAYSRDRNELGRLQLALLMCVPGSTWRDDARLLMLLEGATSRKAAAESPRRHLVELLLRLVAERQREQKRADELQQKLDSMMTIERSLRGRQPRKYD